MYNIHVPKNVHLTTECFDTAISKKYHTYMCRYMYHIMRMTHHRELGGAVLIETASWSAKRKEWRDLLPTIYKVSFSMSFPISPALHLPNHNHSHRYMPTPVHHSLYNTANFTWRNLNNGRLAEKTICDLIRISFQQYVDRSTSGKGYNCWLITAPDHGHVTLVLLLWHSSC